LPDIDFITWGHDGPAAISESKTEEYGRDFYGSGSTECSPLKRKLPFFHFQKRPESYDILLPFFRDNLLGTDKWYTIYNEISAAATEYPWEKKINKMFWRGGSSGGVWDMNNLDIKPRGRLVKTCQSLPDKCDAALLPNLPQMANPDVENYIRSNYRISDSLPFNEWMKYKYEIIVDGNGSPAGRTEIQLLHNSLLFIVEGDAFQYYTPYLQPFVHYIPIYRNISNLEEMYDWAERQPIDVISKIIENANNFAKDYLNPPEVRKYGKELIEEYAKLLKFSPKNVTVPGCNAIPEKSPSDDKREQR